MVIIKNNIGQPFFLIWSVRMFDVFEQTGGAKIYARAFTYFASVTIMFWLFLSATIKDVIQIMTDTPFHSAFCIVPLVALGYVLREFSDFFKGVLLIKQRTSYIGYFTLFTAVVATVLYVILIPRYDVWGAAWATFATFAIMALSRMEGKSLIGCIGIVFRLLTTGFAFLFYLAITVNVALLSTYMIKRNRPRRTAGRSKR